MSLINKIFQNQEPTAVAHTVSAILRLYFVGETTKFQTRTDLETMFRAQEGGQSYSLTAGEKNQLDEWKAFYDAISTTNQKQFWLLNLESTIILAGEGLGVYLNRPQFKAINGLTTD